MNQDQFNSLLDFIQNSMTEMEFQRMIVSFKAQGLVFPDEVDRISFLDSMRTWSKFGDVGEYLRQRFSDRLLPEPEPQESPQPKQPSIPERVPFTNREEDLDRVLSSFAPAYFLLDAPAGYGKTELLKELERRFGEQKWVCTCVSTEKYETLQGLASRLAQNLDVLLTPDSDAERLGRGLAGALKRQRANDISQGVALLVDLEEKPHSQIVKDLVEKFIPAVQKSLRGLRVFKTQHNRFRVVLAGRYLARQVKAPPIPLAIRKLTPFDYKVVQDTVRDYLTEYADYDEEWISNLAAHLMYLTGGHPGCMARVLEMYVKEGFPHPDDFLRDYGEKIWKEIVGPVSTAVRDDIPQHLRTPLDELSIFRYLDYGVLHRLISSNEALIQRYKDANEMADDLTTNYLLDWKGRLLRDDITRRLLAVRLRYEVGPDKFTNRCQQAQAICKERLQEPAAKVPEMWAVEYLYQSLQQYAGRISQKREEAYSALFGREDAKEEGALQDSLRWLAGSRDVRVEQKALEQALEEDWEFRFTVNYYLRRKQYCDEPYEELQRGISRFFAQETGGSNG